jgi:hypothetical protein
MALPHGAPTTGAETPRHRRAQRAEGCVYAEWRRWLARRAAAPGEGRRQRQPLRLESPASGWGCIKAAYTLSDCDGAVRISTTVPSPTRQIARVKSYGDVLEEYEFHEEAKCAEASGAPSGKQSSGLLFRRRVAIGSPHFIGKESNKLEEVEEGGVPDVSDVYTEYPDPRRDEWETKWLPLLRSTPVPTLLGQGVSRATIYAARAGRPLYARTKQKLVEVLRRLKTG